MKANKKPAVTVKRPTTKQALKNGPKRATKLLAIEHTGRLRHHRHTSYGALALLLLIASIPIMSASRAVASADSASYGVYAVVIGPAPKAPTISNLTSGRVFTTNAPLLIQGACEQGSLVKVFKNEVLAGAALCQQGSYQIKIDLFIGNNSLIARAYNTNDMTSPDSATVSVQLQLPGSNLQGSDQLNTQGAPAGQFYVTSEAFHRGAAAGEAISWPLTLFGGRPPYAVSVSWGDGKTELFSRGDANRFDISHTYAEPAGAKGGYTIIVNATDQSGATSYLQLVAVVGGPGHQGVGIASSISGGYGHSGAIKLAMQVFGGAVLLVAGFWIGEKREARLLRAVAGRAG